MNTIPESNPSTDSEPVEVDRPEATYELTVEEASRLFAEAGTPRSPRTIIRYCAKGHLDCIKADTQRNEKYLIAKDSVDRRIQELRQLAVTRRDQTRPDISRHDASGDEPSLGAPRERGDGGSAKRIHELEAEVRDLEITNRAKDWYLERLENEQAMLLGQVSEKSHRIGQLEERLQLRGGAIRQRLGEGRDRETGTSVRDNASEAGREENAR